MNNNKLYNILLTAILGLCLFFWNRTNTEKNELKGLSNLYLQKYKQNSLEIIAKREKQIKYLEAQIVKKQTLIQKSYVALDSLKHLKSKVNVVYVNKVKDINDFNSNQLENYFNEELN